MGFYTSSSVAVLMTALVGLNVSVQAQEIPSTVQPGSVEQEFRAPDPSLNRDSIALPAPAITGLPEGVSNVSFVLKGIELEGNAVFSTSQLEKYYKNILGDEVRLSRVFEVASAVTRHYAEAGYALSIAYVPAQEIEDGKVRITVVEGYIAEVSVVSEGGSLQGHVGQGGIVERRVEAIKSDKPLTSEVLERELLLLNDLPGISARAVLDQSQQGIGATSLILDIETKSVEARAGFDNRGSKALGPSRLNAQVSFNNFMTTGGQLTLNTVRTAGSSDLQHYGAQTRIPLSGSDLEVVSNLSWTDSKPGLADLRTLEFASDGLAAGIGVRYPLLRSRSKNIIVSGGLRMQNSTSDFLSVANSKDKTRAFDATLSYDRLSDAGAFTSVSVTLTRGLGIFDATANDSPLKSRFDADFSGTKVAVNAALFLPFEDGLSLRLMGELQNGFDPLPAAEQCGYGGASFGRGFDSFELSGDSCAMASAELQKTWRRGADGSGFVQLYGFADIGAVELKGIVEAPLERTSSATSMGLGLRFSVLSYFNVGLEYAKPMERDVRIEGNRKSRLFFNISANF